MFRTFLEYLYGKPFDFDKMSIQELVELLAVADRFEVREERTESRDYERDGLRRGRVIISKIGN